MLTDAVDSLLQFFGLLCLIDKETAAVVLVVLGLFLGSFYNVCSDRYLSGESILWPPSHCTACNAKLSPAELIPLVSWLILRGRCRHCGAVIGKRYPLMELASGFFGFLIGWRWGFCLETVIALGFTGLFLVLSAIDFQAFLLPDKMTLPGALIAIPAGALGLAHGWMETIAGGITGTALFWLLSLYYRLRTGRDGLGFGDVKLMAVLGSLCGLTYLPMIVLIAGVTALASFGFLAIKRGGVSGISGIMMPFGPFLCLAGWVSLVYGEAILKWWIQWLIG